MNEDGTMARFNDLLAVRSRFNLKMVSIEALVAYRMQNDRLIEKEFSETIETRFGAFQLNAYRQTTNDQIHLAFTKGEWQKGETVTVRIQPQRLTDGLVEFLTASKDNGLENVFSAVQEEDKAAIIFINHRLSNSGLLSRFRSLSKSKAHNGSGVKMDEKDFGIGAQILNDLNLNKIRLMTNSDLQNRVGLAGYGIEIDGVIGY
jgi:3,4-dihydroxy 2-butanone 4-phosphate synthase/GTP cyclohydrolase II